MLVHSEKSARETAILDAVLAIAAEHDVPPAHVAIGWILHKDAASSTALVPILIVGLFWFALRLRFARRASAAQRFIDAAPDLDLFALRAMAKQPMPRLAAVSDDPAGAWRRGDDEIIRALALLELREVGLRPPVVSGW